MRRLTHISRMTGFRAFAIHIYPDDIFFHKTVHSYPWNDWLQSLLCALMPQRYIFTMRRLTHIRGMTGFKALSVRILLEDTFFTMRRLTHIRGISGFRAFSVRICPEDTFLPWDGSLISVECLASERSLSTYASMIYFSKRRLTHFRGMTDFRAFAIHLCLDDIFFFHEASHSYPWIDWLQSLCYPPMPRWYIFFHEAAHSYPWIVWLQSLRYPHIPRWYIFTMRRLTHIRGMSGFRAFAIHIYLDDIFLHWGGSLISVECLASEPLLSTYTSMIHLFSMRRLTHIRGLSSFRAFAIHIYLGDIFFFSMRRLTHIRGLSGFRAFAIHIYLDDIFLPWDGSLISVECLASEPSLSTYTSMIHFYTEAAHSYP